MKKIKYYKGDKKKMKEKFTKIIPIMVLCIMLSMPVVSNAASASNTSYNYGYLSSSGFSSKLKVTLTQKNSSNPGIGWTRINY